MDAIKTWLSDLRCTLLNKFRGPLMRPKDYTHEDEQKDKARIAALNASIRQTKQEWIEGKAGFRIKFDAS